MASVEDGRGGVRTAEETGGQFASFFVDNLLFGVEVLRVQEVLRYQEMTSVPRAPEVIEGLINLRGQIVTAIDMRRRLGLPSRGEGRSPMNIVVRAEDGAVSLLVDEIGDVVEVEEAAFEAAPENVDARIRDLTTGMYKLKDRLLLILDTRKAIEVNGGGDAAERS
jgi:purine-binding chemotaxis protein CheW